MVPARWSVLLVCSVGCRSPEAVCGQMQDHLEACGMAMTATELAQCYDFAETCDAAEGRRARRVWSCLVKEAQTACDDVLDESAAAETCMADLGIELSGSCADVFLHAGTDTFY